MKNVRQVLAFTLALALVLAAISTVSAFAANNDSLPPQAALEEGAPEMAVISTGSMQGAPETVLMVAEAGTYLEEFPDANFRRYVLDLLNADGGGRTDSSVVTAADEIRLASFLKLNVGGKSISDMTGLQYFLGLTDLSCWDNKLTALDVSKNTALKRLDCYFNPLNTLDITKNKALEYLDCDDTRLRVLNVSENTALKELICCNNQLTDLDVSKNTALLSLDCTFNYIASTDKVIGWQALKLDLGDTFLFRPQNDGEPPTGRDITAAFIDAGFLAAIREITEKPTEPILDYDVAQIQDLYIAATSTPQIIFDLSGIEHFRSLTDLNCSYQQLSKLDLSKNTGLSYLDCNGNQLKTLNVSSNTALEILFCDSNQLNVLDISKNTELWLLSIDENKLTALDVSKNTGLAKLYCCDNQLTALNVSNNALLEYLDCRENYLPSTNAVTGWQALGLVEGVSFIFKPQKTGIITCTGAIYYQESSIRVTVTLRNNGDGSTTTAYTNADGTFTLVVTTPQEGARYTLKVTKPGYLSYTINELVLTDGLYVGSIDIRQLAGDVNGDGIVNAVDLTCLLSEFNRKPQIFLDADIDGNGMVNAADLTYLLAGFNKRDVVVVW